MHPPHTLLDVTLLHLSPVSQRLIQLEGHRLEVVLVVLELDVELRWSFYVAHPHRHYMEREREREIRNTRKLSKQHEAYTDYLARKTIVLVFHATLRTSYSRSSTNIISMFRH